MGTEKKDGQSWMDSRFTTESTPRRVWDAVSSLVVGGLILLAIAYFAGNRAGYEKGVRVGNVMEFERGREQGLVEGLQLGEELGYADGYRDRARGIANRFEAGAWEQLGKRRYEVKRGYMRFSGVLALFLLLYWVPFLFKPAASRQVFPSWAHLRGSVARLREPAFRYGTVAKVLLSLVSLVCMGMLVPGTQLSRWSSLYVNAVPNELLVVATGGAAAIVLVRLIELSSTRVSGERKTLAVQLAWTVLMAAVVHQFAGGFAGARAVDAPSGIHMLLLQTGASLGMALYLLGWILAATWKRLRSPRRAAAPPSPAVPPALAGTAG